MIPEAYERSLMELREDVSVIKERVSFISKSQEHLSSLIRNGGLITQFAKLEQTVESNRLAILEGFSDMKASQRRIFNEQKEATSIKAKGKYVVFGAAIGAVIGTVPHLLKLVLSAMNVI